LSSSQQFLGSKLKFRSNSQLIRLKAIGLSRTTIHSCSSNIAFRAHQIVRQTPRAKLAKAKEGMIGSFATPIRISGPDGRADSDGHSTATGLLRT
jgi:hypothetical protein